MSDPVEPAVPDHAEPTPRMPPSSSSRGGPADSAPQDKGPRSWQTWARYAIWIVVGGIAIYLIATGVVGILTKAR